MSARHKSVRPTSVSGKLGSGPDTGVWLRDNDIEDPDHIEVRLRDPYSREWIAAGRRLLQAERTTGEPDGGIAGRLRYCADVVTDWLNVVDDDGHPLPCTPANVERVCADRPHLVVAIHAKAIDLNNAISIHDAGHHARYARS